MSEHMTDRQRAFVSFYLGEANFNGTQAARLAGYSHPRQSATENLAKPYIQQEVAAHLETLKNEGIRLKSIRLQKLVDLDTALEDVQRARANEAREKIARGESVAAGAETGMLAETVKVGPRGNVTEYVVDKSLISERRAIMEQVAKELGETIDKLQVSGDGSNPLVVQSAKDKLLELADDE